jgi:hypothetical protein
MILPYYLCGKTFRRNIAIFSSLMLEIVGYAQTAYKCHGKLLGGLEKGVPREDAFENRSRHKDSGIQCWWSGSKVSCFGISLIFFLR